MEIIRHHPSSDESCFDYRSQRDELLLFMIALMHRNFDSPVRVHNRRQACGRNCGNSELDSRCFTRQCHHSLEAAHPPHSERTTKRCGLSHTGDLLPSAHWNVKMRRAGEFKSGLTPAIVSAYTNTSSTPKSNSGVANVLEKSQSGVVGSVVGGSVQIIDSKIPTATTKELAAEAARQGQSWIWRKTGQPLETVDNIRFYLPPGKTLKECVASDSCDIERLGPVGQITSAGGMALKTAGSALLLYQVAEFAGSAAGFGSWTCCGGVRNGKITGNSEGCRQKWSCCGAWQDVGADAEKAGCTRKVCKFCKGEYDLDPAADSLEMRCSNDMCKRGDENGYVGRRYEGVKIAPPCRTLSKGERHDVQDL